jgi:amino acid transporter
MSIVDSRPSLATPVEARLTLWDAVSIIVGIVIGVGIYKAPTQVFNSTSGPWEALGVWVLGGLLSFVGALCFAELACAYPRSGGEYVYLSRAYGSWMGLLFAWAQMTVVRTGGSIAVMAFAFADYAAHLWDLSPTTSTAWAVAAIGILTFINWLGINAGKRTQNALTIAKVVGLSGIVLAGFLGSHPTAPPTEASGTGGGAFALAMIFVLYTYDGWNEAVYVTAEVRNSRRNLPLALLLGTGAITVIYLLVNAAYLAGLGFARARSSEAIAAEVLESALGGWGGKAMSVLVMVSALGALNGTILTGSRLYSELGVDHPALTLLRRWNRGRGSPVGSLLLQAGISIGMVAAVGIWRNGQKGFEKLVEATAPVFWLFLLLTAIALLVLRYRDPAVPRPFRVPGYPIVPLIFCGWCGYMLYGSIAYAQLEALAGAGVLLAGLPFILWAGKPAK